MKDWTVIPTCSRRTNIRINDYSPESTRGWIAATRWMWNKNVKLPPAPPLCSERKNASRAPSFIAIPTGRDGEDVIWASECGPDGVHNQGEIVFELCEWESRTNRHSRNHIFALDAQKLILCRPIEVQSFLLIWEKNCFSAIHILFCTFCSSYTHWNASSSRHPMLLQSVV